MKKIILFYLFTSVFFPKDNFGCSCLAPSSFCESITDSDGNLNPDVILRGKITGNSPEGKKIKIDQVIHGEVSQSEISIKHTFCTLFYSELEEGADYIIALRRNNGGFYSLNCAIYFLKIENEIVKGKIAPGIESIAYNDLGTLESCGNAFNFFSIANNILIFPNPTRDEIKIKNTGTANYLEHLELKIFDTIGRELQTNRMLEGILQEEDWVIDIQSFPAGLYLFKLTGKYQEKTFKIVKQ